ncbi:MAG TPA: hypothetical protein VK752_20115 [Bryobacteraceae bacterium]|nr:hypothetical protein [Bryobacteraceae bacterium]
MQSWRIAAALLSLAFRVPAEDLLKQLSWRSATEGLALIYWNGVPVRVVTFDDASQATWSSPFLASQTVSTTPYLSNAWFSAIGDAVAWSHHKFKPQPFFARVPDRRV